MFTIAHGYGAATDDEEIPMGLVSGLLKLTLLKKLFDMVTNRKRTTRDRRRS